MHRRRNRATAEADKPHRPLCQIVEPDPLGQNIAVELRKAVSIFSHSMLEENPFQPIRPINLQPLIKEKTSTQTLP